MINKQSVFQRLIIYSVEAYLSDIAPDRTYRYDFMIKLRSAIRGYIYWHKFSKEEAKIVTDLADTPFMESLSKLEIDRTIYALELLVLYINEIPKADRAILNISDQKILRVKSELILDMLNMRKTTPKDHKKINDVVSDSRINAKKYFKYCEEQIII